VEQFALFAEKEKFLFVSSQTEAALEILSIARLEQSSPESIACAEELVKIAREDDRRRFFAHWDYIDMRLRQAAYDRKFGSYRSFAEAIVNVRPDIKFAAQMLRRGTS
jgi:hypothetical protein